MHQYYFNIIGEVCMTNYDNIKDGMNYGLGAASGYASYKLMPKIFKLPIKHYLLDTFYKIPKRENDAFYSSAVKAYENSFLSKPRNIKGIKHAEIIHVDIFNKDEVYQEIAKRWLPKSKKCIINQNWFKRIFVDKYKMLEKHLDVVSNGKNAFCVPRLKDKSSLVVLNKDKMGFSTFHELGHAVNAQSHGYKKFLNVMRGPIALLIPLTLITGLLTNRSDDENSDMGKFINGLKDNSGLIAAACTVPTIAEEGVASINAAKLAKGVLDKDLYKKLNKLNAKAWCSYLLSAVVIGSAVEFSVKLRYKIVESKPVQKIFN